MVILNKNIGHRGMFYVGQDGAIEAELVYHFAKDGTMVIEHTEVGDTLAGQGVGKMLVETAVNYSRTHHIKVLPLCPFAKALFDKTPEWQDLLA